MRHHLRQHLEQGFAFLRREHGGGLIEDQDARATVQGFENLNALALTDRQAADLGLGIDLQAKALRDFLQPLTRRAMAREGLPHRLGTHHHVFQHAQVVGQREVLVHHADASGQRGLRVARGQWLAKDLDLAGIGRVMTKQDRDQG